MAMINDKAALLGAAQRKKEVVPVTGGDVLVVEIGAVEYMRMLEECKGELADKPIVHIVASWATVTESGERLFTVEEFAQLDRATQVSIGNMAMKLNWAQGDEKNEVASQDEDSPSGSL